MKIEEEVVCHVHQSSLPAVKDHDQTLLKGFLWVSMSLMVIYMSPCLQPLKDHNWNEETKDR